MLEQDFYLMALTSKAVGIGDGEGAGDDGGGDDGGDGGITPEMQAIIDKAVGDAKATMQQQITATNTKNKELLDKLADSKKAWGDLDPETVRNTMKMFEENQDLKDIADGKFQEVLDRKMEKERSTYNSTVTTLEEENANLKKQVESSNGQISKLVIDGQATAEFTKLGGAPEAIVDMVARANSIFKLEDGTPIARDANGEIIEGKNGPITINEWAGSLVESAPHFFGNSSGPDGGDGGSRRSGLEAKLAAAAAANDMTEYRRIKTLIKESKAKK